MTLSLTKKQFEETIKSSPRDFTEYRKFMSDIYKVEYLGESFLKCAIQRIPTGVHIIYLDSHYEKPEHQIQLLGYVTFVIAVRLNRKKQFERVEINNNGEIFTL